MFLPVNWATIRRLLIHIYFIIAWQPATYHQGYWQKYLLPPQNNSVRSRFEYWLAFVSASGQKGRNVLKSNYYDDKSWPLRSPKSPVTWPLFPTACSYCQLVATNLLRNPSHLLHKLTLIQTWISKYYLYNVWDEIAYLFPNLNGVVIEVWKFYSLWRSVYIHTRVKSYPC